MGLIQDMHRAAVIEHVLQVSIRQLQRWWCPAADLGVPHCCVCCTGLCQRQRRQQLHAALHGCSARAPHAGSAATLVSWDVKLWQQLQYCSRLCYIHCVTLHACSLLVMHCAVCVVSTRVSATGVSDVQHYIVCESLCMGGYGEDCPINVQP
jgi:hypothetical protein